MYPTRSPVGERLTYISCASRTSGEQKPCQLRSRDWPRVQEAKYVWQGEGKRPTQTT